MATTTPTPKPTPTIRTMKTGIRSENYRRSCRSAAVTTTTNTDWHHQRWLLFLSGTSLFFRRNHMVPVVHSYPLFPSQPVATTATATAASRPRKCKHNRCYFHSYLDASSSSASTPYSFSYSSSSLSLSSSDMDEISASRYVVVSNHENEKDGENEHEHNSNSNININSSNYGEERSLPYGKLYATVFDVPRSFEEPNPRGAVLSEDDLRLISSTTKKNTNMDTSTSTDIRIDTNTNANTNEDSSTNSQRRNAQQQQQQQQQQQTANFVDNGLKWMPLLIPVLAYWLYDATAGAFSAALDVLAQNKWVAVDGGAYQAKIIAPAINGVVVPAISILFANLIGTTITTLRQRQLDIRTCLNMEAGQLRILQSILDAFPTSTITNDNVNVNVNVNVDAKDSQAACRRYLTQYTSRLIAESQPTLAAIDSLDDEYSFDTELNGVLTELHQLTCRTITSSTSTRSTASPPVSDLLLGNAYTAVGKLYEERAKRITALRSLFPPLHFSIVSALAVSICVAFLLESKQDILVFLNAIQLRVLWTMLVGTFSSLAIVCYDLGNPFRGSYQIGPSVHPLYTIRLAFKASLSKTNNISGESSSNSIRGESSSRSINGDYKER